MLRTSYAPVEQGASPLLRHPHSGYSRPRNSHIFPIRPLIRHPSHFQPAHSQKRVTEETLTSLAFAFALCYARLPGFAFHFPVFPSSSFPYDQVNLMTPGISIVSHNPGEKLKTRNTYVAPHPLGHAGAKTCLLPSNSLQTVTTTLCYPRLLMSVIVHNPDRNLRLQFSHPPGLPVQDPHSRPRWNRFP